MDVNRAQCITTKEYFSRLYDDICHNLQQTTDDISKLHVDNEDGKKQLNVMMEQLQTLQNNFNHKLNYLKQHAEWDRFTVAFFGETNAGKSTIIESLRVFFDELSRKQLLQNNQNDLQQAEQVLCENLEMLRRDLIQAYSEVANKTRDIRLSAKCLQQIIANESQSRLQILQQQTHAKVRFTLLATACGCFIAGAGGMAALLSQIW
ncbi:hypothetical protein ABGT00_004818 [Escherichia coli]